LTNISQWLAIDQNQLLLFQRWTDSNRAEVPH